MSSEAVIAFIGTLVGSCITLSGIFLSHRLIVKREEHKTRIKQEEDAISEIFSPLVFIMERTREVFLRIIAFKNTIEELSKTERQDKAISILKYFAIAGVESYPQTLEKLLMEKSGFIKSQQLYLDLAILQNYLSTIVSFMLSALLGSKQNPDEVSKSLESFSPIIQELDEVISRIWQYSIAKICRMQKYEYKQFFTEEKHLEIENHLEQLSIAITGEAIINWANLIKQLGERRA